MRDSYDLNHIKDHIESVLNREVNERGGVIDVQYARALIKNLGGDGNIISEDRDKYGNYQDVNTINLYMITLLAIKNQHNQDSL